MSTSYHTSLFLFRRDLRLSDNTGLLHALRTSKYVIPCFILDSQQVGNDNDYRSANSIQFMMESLADLDEQLREHDGKLILLYDKTIDMIQKIIRHTKIDAIFLNHDYTPFSKKRDHAIELLCKKHDIAFHAFHDALLIGDPSSIVGTSKKPYGVFSAFFKKTLQFPVADPHSLPRTIGIVKKIAIETESLSAMTKKLVPKPNKHIKVHGGRKNALRILRSLEKFSSYKTERNFPAADKTTHLSAAHKFGTISIRESYHAIKKALGGHSTLLQELYWRDFFTYVAFHNPHVFGKPYQKRYEKLQWNTSKKDFEAWCAGTTGFPIIDAGMRELNTTGYMHNRVRMIVASFLIKDLHINWLWGERYFAQQLVDYDPAVNNGNWQWSASTGCDAQPYFRIFNPWLQQKKFDSECTYIKRWVPELKSLDSRTIHSWYKPIHAALKNYPKPMVDHAVEAKKAIQWYKQAK